MRGGTAVVALPRVRGVILCDSPQTPSPEEVLRLGVGHEEPVLRVLQEQYDGPSGLTSHRVLKHVHKLLHGEVTRHAPVHLPQFELPRPAAAAAAAAAAPVAV